MTFKKTWSMQHALETKYSWFNDGILAPDPNVPRTHGDWTVWWNVSAKSPSGHAKVSIILSSPILLSAIGTERVEVGDNWYYNERELPPTEYVGGAYRHLIAHDLWAQFWDACLVTLEQAIKERRRQMAAARAQKLKEEASEKGIGIKELQQQKTKERKQRAEERALNANAQKISRRVKNIAYYSDQLKQLESMSKKLLACLASDPNAFVLPNMERFESVVARQANVFLRQNIQAQPPKDKK